MTLITDRRATTCFEIIARQNRLMFACIMYGFVLLDSSRSFYTLVFVAPSHRPCK